MEKLENIVLIGPVYPYKGGIAHYTGLLYKNLSQKYHVTAISYKLQYPKFLYKKEQKDFSNETLKIANCDHTMVASIFCALLLDDEKIFRKNKSNLFMSQCFSS